MKRWAGVAAGVGFALVLSFALFVPFGPSENDESSMPASSSFDEEHQAGPRILTASTAGDCQLEGTVRGGMAGRVRVHLERAGLDLEASVEGGRRFVLRLPEQGRFFVVATAADGRSATAASACDASGHASVEVTFTRGTTIDATVSGTCVFLDTGAPVDEAWVRVTYAVFDRGARAEVESVAAAVTDEHGRFTLIVPAGQYALRCGRDANESEPRQISIEAGQVHLVELYVEARAGVSGVVRGPDGTPRSGVAVTGRHARSGVTAPSVTERTDGEGRFLLLGFLPGPVRVEAHASDGFAEGTVQARVELPYADLELMLRPAKRGIEGTVVDTDGTPVVGVCVQVGPSRAPSDRRSRGPGEHRATLTNETGGFVIGGLLPGRYRVATQMEGYAESSAEVELQDGFIKVQFVLRTACTSRIRVEPEDPSLPVVVQVWPRKAGDSRPRQIGGRTGEELRLEEAFGVAHVMVQTAGREVRTASVTADLCAEPIVLTLSASDAERGRVRVFVADAAKAAVPGVRVQIRGAASMSDWTDTEGIVVFGALRPGKYVVFSGDVPPEEVMVSAGEETAVELVISRKRGEIQGTVVAGGAPVEGARIRAACADSGRSPDLSRGSVTARSGADGSFAFTPEDGGICLVGAEHPSLGRSTPVTLEAGGEPALIELRAGGTILGRVIQASGAPVAPYTLQIDSQSRAAEIEGRSVHVTDPSGHFEVRDVLPGTVSLSVWSEQGRAQQQLTLGAGEVKSDVELEVFTNGQVTGRVLSADGPPVVRAVINLRNARGRRSGRTATGSDGRFSVSVAAGESLEAFADHPDFYPGGSGLFVLSADGPTDIGDLVLQPKGAPEDKEAGIGIQMMNDPEGIRIVRFTEDSPARDAGLKVGDVITAIDGVSFGQAPLINWMVRLRGAVGTSVALRIMRGTKSPFSITVVRRAVGLSPIGP